MQQVLSFILQRFLLKALCCLILIIPFWGCSSFYYFPSKKVLVFRDKMPLAPEDVYFQSEDGTRLHGWYFAPLNRAEPKAVIVQFHGNAQNLTTHFFNLYEAPSRGIAYLSFDYRGYGESAGKPSPAGVVMDGIAAIRWMHSRHSQAPLVVVGQSLGGAIAFRSVNKIKNEIPISLMMVDSTFADYRTQARSLFSRSFVTFLFQPLAWLLADNSESPKGDIPEIAPIPLIVMHGTKDSVVAEAMGREVFDRAKEPKEFWDIPNADHLQAMFIEEGEYGERFYQRVNALGDRRPR